jgi:hypothetical protein
MKRGISTGTSAGVKARNMPSIRSIIKDVAGVKHHKLKGVGNTSNYQAEMYSP